MDLPRLPDRSAGVCGAGGFGWAAWCLIPSARCLDCSRALWDLLQ
uniref:Uncharacterized protein n=1 Tax=Arundo donax TaxID=35708 RepID=A0A0A9H9F4_ARUDO